MLAEPRAPGRRRPRQQSLRQEYGEFILERIEEFKDQLSREELLTLADEAVRELEAGPEGQLVLTEVLVLEQVDKLIIRHLNLPTFRRWRERHVHLRRAQRAPTHWGLDRRSPLVRLAESFEEADVALVVGLAASPAGLFLAAHEWPVVFIDRHITSVEAAETRAATEALARWFQAYVVNLGEWFPDVEPALTILDAATLMGLNTPARQRFLDTLQGRTLPGGVHFLLLGRVLEGTKEELSDLLRAQYDKWHVEQPARMAMARWFLAVKP